MARKALIQKELKKAKLVAKYAELRKQLKAQGDFSALAQLPRSSSATRQRNRCGITGRPKGFMRRFGLSRIEFRERALGGELPGVKKISW